MRLHRRFVENFFVFFVPMGWFFLFLPLDLYHRNRDEWGVSAGEFLIYGLCSAVLMAGALALIDLFLRAKNKLYFKTLVYALFAVAFLHTFLPVAAEERELTGVLLDFHFPLSVHLLSLAGMGVSSVFFILLRRRLFAVFSSTYVWLSAVILLASLALTWSSLSTAEGVSQRTAGKLDPAQLYELYTLSNRRNVLLLILDTVPADVALEVIEAHEAVESTLKDFIFYKNNLSIAPQTYMSMANLHIGSFWDESFDEHQQASPGKVRDQSFFNLLADAGWKLAMAGRGPCPSKLAICGSTNTQNLGFGGNFGLSEPFIQAINLALFKTSPILLKRWVYNDEEFLFKTIDVFRLQTTPHDSPAATPVPRFASEAQRDNYFLTFLADHGLVGDATPRFKLFHLMSAHPRFYLDAQCNKGSTITDSRDGMKNHVKCQFDAIAHLVDRLRDKGVYDATTLIIASDHGINYPSAFLPPQHTNGKIADFEQMVTQANALLMIKYENAHQSRMTLSAAPTSTVDITQTICEIARLNCQGKYPDSISLLPGHSFPSTRLRLYAHHGYGAENAERNGMELYAVQGELWNAASWRYIAHLPGKGGGVGDSTREALKRLRSPEEGGSAG